MSTVALVLAGGSGTRMRPGLELAGAEVVGNKVHLPLAGRNLLERSLTIFAASPLVDEVVLVIRAGDEAAAAAAVATAAPSSSLTTRITTGGTTRTASERAGLAVVADQIRAGTVTLVAIHDAARPFVSDRLLTDLLTTARQVGGAVPTIEVGSRVLARGGADPGLLPTADLRRMQTPQVFQAGPLLTAYERAGVDAEGRDTAEIVQTHEELTVASVPGDPRNLKLTVAADLEVARRLAAAWDAGADGARTG